MCWRSKMFKFLSFKLQFLFNFLPSRCNTCTWVPIIRIVCDCIKDILISLKFLPSNWVQLWHFLKSFSINLWKCVGTTKVYLFVVWLVRLMIFEKIKMALLSLQHDINCYSRKKFVWNVKNFFVFFLAKKKGIHFKHMVNLMNVFARMLLEVCILFIFIL